MEVGTHSMRRSKNTGFAMVAGLSLALLAAPAWANMVSSGSAPGNSCHALDGKQVGDVSLDNGRATNTSGNNRQVVCPIPVSKIVPYTYVQSLVFVDDNSSTETVSCTFHVRDSMAEQVYKENKILDTPPSGSALPAGAKYVGKSVAIFGYTSIASSDHNYYLWCRLPPNSSVLSFEWLTADER